MLSAAKHLRAEVLRTASAQMLRCAQHDIFFVFDLKRGV